MKRWLIGSLALNVILIGVGVGFFAPAIFRMPPPPFGPRPGLERDLRDAVDSSLSGAEQARAKAILDDHFKALDARIGDRKPPRPEDLLAAFVDGKLAEALPPPDDPAFEARRKAEMETLRLTFLDLAKALDRPARQRLADGIRGRMEQVRACIDRGRRAP